MIRTQFIFRLLKVKMCNTIRKLTNAQETTNSVDGGPLLENHDNTHDEQRFQVLGAEEGDPTRLLTGHVHPAASL